MKAINKLLCILTVLGVYPLFGQDASPTSEVDVNQHIPAGLPVGQTAPDFNVRDIQGQNVGLKQALREGSLVLVFYKGSWDGEDMQFLFTLNDSLATLENAGAQVIALSAEQSSYTEKINSKRKVTYSLAQDVGGRIAKSYDVLFNVDEQFCKELMHKGNINLQERYDVEQVMMAAPAIFIISTQGKIIFSHFDFDAGNRPYISELAQALEKPGEQRATQPPLEETGSEPVKKSKKKRKKD